MKRITQPLNKTYHVIIRRKSPDEPIADILGEQVVGEKSSSIKAVGGDISLSRTFQTDHTYLVVSLPDAVDIKDFFDIDLVKEVQADA